MASSFTVDKIVDGSRETTIKVNITGDTSSELSLAEIFDASTYFNTGVHKRLRKIQYELTGFSGNLFWDGSTDLPLITLEKDHYSEADFKDIGYLNKSAVAAPTGDILLTTVGLTTNLSGYIILFIESKDIVDGER